MRSSTQSGPDAEKGLRICRGSFTTTTADRNIPPQAGVPPPIAFTDRLIEVGIEASIGATGSSYDNALAETINGLYKTELIKPRGPWRTVEHVEIATWEWVDWFNHRRLYEHCGDVPPAEPEATSATVRPDFNKSRTFRRNSGG